MTLTSPTFSPAPIQKAHAMSTLVVERRSRSRRGPVAESPLRSFARFVVYLGLGAFIGLGSTWYVLENGISLDRITLGPWVMRADAGQPIADPYTSAYIARTGHIPMRFDGAMYFTASTDGDGAALQGDCSYAVYGTAPSGAWWTLSLQDGSGNLVENPAKRYSFSSTNVLYEQEDQFRISVSPTARAGNWLPTGGPDPFVLMLRIHGPDPDYVRDPASVVMPEIETEQCS